MHSSDQRTDFLAWRAGFVSKLWSLVMIRFFFGAGEAGASPTASTSVFRWFPTAERGRAFGVIFLSSQLGGAIAPLLIVPLQVHFGWRASFYVFGVLGIVWVGGWWRWYRNYPQEKTGITDLEQAEIRPRHGSATLGPEGGPASRPSIDGGDPHYWSRAVAAD